MTADVVDLASRRDARARAETTRLVAEAGDEPWDSDDGTGDDTGDDGTARYARAKAVEVLAGCFADLYDAGDHTSGADSSDTGTSSSNDPRVGAAVRAAGSRRFCGCERCIVDVVADALDQFSVNR